MTGTDLCVNKPHKSRSYLKHLLFPKQISVEIINSVTVGKNNVPL